MEVTGLGDLCDEHGLHVKYHIMAMTAVAYAHTSITGLASDGEVCMCVLDCCETAHWVFFSVRAMSVCEAYSVYSCAHPVCERVLVSVHAAGASVFHSVCWG